MKKIRVLYVHHCGVPGGASTSLINLLDYLPDEKVEKYLVVPKGSINKVFALSCKEVFVLSKNSVANFFPSAEGIDFLWPRSLLGYIRFYSTLKEIRDIAREVQPDVVHFNDLPLIPSAIELKKLGFPIVMHARTAPGRKRGFLDRLQRKWINKYVDKLVCISGSVQNGFSDIINSTIVYNPAIPPEAVLPENQALSNDVLNCVFLSNFLPYKGIYETLEAAKLLKEHNNIHFYIAGSNIREEAFYKSLRGRILNFLTIAPDITKWIHEFIQSNALTNVTLLGRVDDINAILRRMHLNLAPMRLNAPPRSVFEAALHEIPTILSLTDIVEDQVENNVTGLIIPPRNPKAIADAILELKGNETLRVAMGKQAKRRLWAQHSPQVGAQMMLSIYEEVVSQIYNSIN